MTNKAIARMRVRGSCITLIALTLALLCGCREPAAPGANKTIKLSMIPTTDPGKMLRDSKPLVDYLEREIGSKVEMTIPTDYAPVVEALANDQVDIAYLGGFTYIQARKRSGVEPLVQREGDQNFHSVFITQTDSPINSLADLKGHTFSFGNVISTSGHLMPEYFMRQNGVDSDVIANAIYSGTHDGTALAVANRKVDAGALDETIYQKLTADGKIDSSKVRVFYTTPPFLDYIWVARKDVDSKVTSAFAAAFLKLDSTNSADKPIMDFLGATRYVKAGDSSYDKLRQAAIEAKLFQ